jgi:hypothetical protein
MRLLVSTVVATLVQGESRERAHFYAEPKPKVAMDFKSSAKVQHSHCGLRIFGQLFYMFFNIFFLIGLCVRGGNVFCHEISISEGGGAVIMSLSH